MTNKENIMKKSKIAKIMAVMGSSVAMTGCNYYFNSSYDEYIPKINNLTETIKQDMKDAGLDVYMYQLHQSEYLHTNINYYVSFGNDGKFLSFDNVTMISNIAQGEHGSLVVYKISDKDYDTINALEKSEFNLGQTYGDVRDTGDIEVLTNVIKDDSSTLYSVKNTKTDELLYSVQKKNENAEEQSM